MPDADHGKPNGSQLRLRALSSVRITLLLFVLLPSCAGHRQPAECVVQSAPAQESLQSIPAEELLKSLPAEEREFIGDLLRSAAPFEHDLSTIQYGPEWRTMTCVVRRITHDGLTCQVHDWNDEEDYAIAGRLIYRTKSEQDIARYLQIRDIMLSSDNVMTAERFRQSSNPGITYYYSSTSGQMRFQGMPQREQGIAWMCHLIETFDVAAGNRDGSPDDVQDAIHEIRWPPRAERLEIQFSPMWGAMLLLELFDLEMQAKCGDATNEDE